MKEWRSKDCKYKIDPKQVKEIEKRFLSIRPSQEVHRLPRAGIILVDAKPKASELDNWANLYSLPCLEGILHQNALEHYALLVKSNYVLSKFGISETELDETQEELDKYVKDYQNLYGADRMTFNVHGLRHAVQSIRESGPLSATSAFPFESNIYNLKQLVTGPTGMDKQIARKHLRKIVFTSENSKSFGINDKAAEYCDKVFSKKKLKKGYETCGDVTFCGPSRSKIIDNIHYACYTKCFKDEVTFHSIHYVKTTKTDDSAVKLRNGRYARIINIFKKNEKCLFQLSEFELYPENPFPPVYHIKKIRSENEDEKKYFIEPIAQVLCKVNIINVRTGRFLGIKPNNVEVQ